MERACALASTPSEKTNAAMRRSARPLVLMIKPGKGIESRLEADLGQLALARLGLEELELVITHGAGDQVRGNRRDRRIEIPDDSVVITSRVLDSVFYSSELCLEIAKPARRLELRVGLHRHRKSAQRCCELILSHRALRRTRALCRHCFGSGLSDRIQSTALVGSVAFYRLDQIGDEISATFELDVDVGPGVLGTHAERDE